MEETFNRLDAAWRQSGKSQMLFVETLKMALYLKEVTLDEALVLLKAYQGRLNIENDDDSENV